MKKQSWLSLCRPLCVAVSTLSALTACGGEDLMDTQSEAAPSGLAPPGVNGQSCATLDGGTVADGSMTPADSGVRTDASDAGVTPPAVDASADASTTAASSPVSIGTVTAAGAGCTAGTTKVDVSEGRDHFDVSFSAFAVEPTAERPRRSSDCTVVLDVTVPPGKTVALERVGVKGSTVLPGSASAELSAYYGFIGGANTVPTPKKALFQGPRTGGFESAIEFSPEERVFRDCGRSRMLALTLGLLVRADPTAGAARASLDSVGSASFVVRDCP